LHSVFAAALIAAAACSMPAPRSIDDCEKIQAADAYNQCLAIFGPVPRGHGAARDSGDTASQDAGAAGEDSGTKVAAAPEEDLGHAHDRRHASRHGWTRHHSARHGGARYGRARYGHWHHTTAAAHRHGKRTTLAFVAGSGRVHLR